MKEASILSDRILAVEESKSVRMAAVISDLRAKGEKIISFNVGEPDFPTPEVIIKATVKALEEGHTRYALVPGQPFLREAIVKKLKKEQDLDVGIENICISNGSKQVLYSIFQLLCNPGDEVIVPRPYWVSFPEAIKLAGAIPVFVDTENNRLNTDNIKRAITSKTKGIVLNTPNNPSGVVFEHDKVKEVLQLCIEHNIKLISDEAYETLIYDHDSFKSPAALGDKSLQHTLIVQSFSKSYCMTGFRLGYLAGDIEFIKGMNKLQSHVCGNTPVFIQKGALAALENDEFITKKMRDTFQERAELAYQLCRDIFPDTIKPQGAFYLFPKIPKELLERFKNDEALSLHILEKAKVALLPGSFFGQPGYLRICFSTSNEEIKEGFMAIKESLK